MNAGANAGKALEGEVCHPSLHQGGCDRYNSQGLVFNVQRKDTKNLSMLLNVFPLYPFVLSQSRGHYRRPVAFYSKFSHNFFPLLQPLLQLCYCKINE
jgi:hypothetical protein